MSKPLQVGVIGASAKAGWARESHVPAIQKLDGLELGAVVVRTQDEADEAARAFGARKGYGDPHALFNDPEIDIVTVAVKVPDHHDLVLGALKAGKHLYCEWPLSPTLAQAQELAAAARRAAVKVAIGLQARASPAVARARELIAGGAVGRVLGGRCYSTSAAWGGVTQPGMVFAEKPEAGVNLVIIQGAHTVDLMISLLGELADASALATRQYSEIAVQGENRSVPRETLDHILVQGALKTGGTLAAETMGGRPEGRTPFELVVMGDEGELALTGGAPRGFQSGRFSLSLNGEPQEVDEGERAGFPDAALNVAGVYARLRDDVLKDTCTSPDFEHAVRLTKLHEDLLTSSSDGRRRIADGWPVS
ncbi:MAG: Gfo/Idh/MocA family oxidoreductase [Xanthobacteraceae bacterium]|nr:Gfo/Idh/MocA family oxidoreductase [Xanthobacteraceae bacterium]